VLVDVAGDAAEHAPPRGVLRFENERDPANASFGRRGKTGRFRSLSSRHDFQALGKNDSRPATIATDFPS
jgi:hypothetical protein